ncbi:MAG: dethiobiotin synthase [Thermodesulfobacteriota bacterium]
MGPVLMQRGLFVAGTDTGVGKSVVAAGLIRLALARGLRAQGVKPVETGCEKVGDSLFPEDGAFLVRASNKAIGLDECTPLRFSMPAAPYRAAKAEGKSVTLAWIEEHVRQLTSRADLTVVEGAGGLMVPMGKDWLLIDLVERLRFPVVLVGRSGLGTINHTLLSLEAMERRRIRTIGVMLSSLSPDRGPEEEYTPGDLNAFSNRVPVYALPHMDRATACDPGRIARELDRVGLGELVLTDCRTS